MLNKTTVAFAASLILGSASAVLAADSGENHQGGPDSTIGVQSPREPVSPDQGIRTEGRGSSESLREEKREEKEEKEESRKDAQNPGPSDSKK
jgi:hypothetical protein